MLVTIDSPIEFYEKITECLKYHLGVELNIFYIDKSPHCIIVSSKLIITLSNPVISKKTHWLSIKNIGDTKLEDYLKTIKYPIRFSTEFEDIKNDINPIPH